jgi:cytochrome c oxidase cbb3-type subunit 4
MQILFDINSIYTILLLCFSMYRRQKKGERDFEKYSKLVHDDSSVSVPLEERDTKKVIGNKEK